MLENPTVYGRNILSKVADSIKFSSAALVNGARQVGKSTFIQMAFVGPDSQSELLSLVEYLKHLIEFAFPLCKAQYAGTFYNDLVRYGVLAQ